MNINELSVILDFAKSAKEYLDLKAAEKGLRREYTAARDKWVNETGSDVKWEEVIENPRFQLAVGKHYKAYLEARRRKSNAASRMETRYRKIR